MFTFKITSIDRLPLKNGILKTLITGEPAGVEKCLVLTNGYKEIRYSNVYIKSIENSPSRTLEVIAGEVDDSDIGTTFYNPV